MKKSVAGLILLAAACSKGPQTSAPAPGPTARVVYVVATPTETAMRAAEFIPPTQVPTAAAISAIMTNEQTFRLAPAATPVTPFMPQERVEPTPPTIKEQMERCLVYSVVEDSHDVSSLLPGVVRLKVEAKNNCQESSFAADDTRFEIQALDRAGRVVAREVARFYDPISPLGRVETRVMMKPGEGFYYRYDVKPWWAAAGGRRVGE